MTTSQLFFLGDLCIDEGYFPGLSDRRYALWLVFSGDYCCEVRRAMVSALLPTPCRVWLVKGRVRCLLGDSDLCPLDLSDGVSPPFIGG